MRIGYIAKHGSGGNNDEDAITFALEKLGHKVERLREQKGEMAYRLECDFVLFHHWNGPEALSRVKVPKCFWNFDLVTYPDPTLAERNARRIRWMSDIIPLVDVGFCTDGDWVKENGSGKLVWLTQGADERMIGRGQPKYKNLPPILFTGTHKGGGRGREAFVSHMQERWRDQFMQVKGVHGRELADFIASAQICVAPDHPATDNYYSNRVFLTAGFGGCLVHPKSKSLETQYVSSVEVVTYSNMENFDYQLDILLSNKQLREDIGYNALERTKREHLYRHRCEILVQTMKERCSL